MVGDFDPKIGLTLAPVTLLATSTPDGRPHLVPVVFALAAEPGGPPEVVYAKPKSTLQLRRLANNTSNPRVSLLLDHYADDWAQLWWVRVGVWRPFITTANRCAPGIGSSAPNIPSTKRFR